MTSLFSKIVQGEIPNHTVWEDEEHLAFLDIQPLADGHTLVIPKLETDYIFDLSTARAEALWSTAHKVAQLLKRKVPCERVAVLVLGYEVAHAHIHLIPTQSESQILQPQRQEIDHPKLAALAAHIRGDTSVSSPSTPVKRPTTIDVEGRWDAFAHDFVAQVERITLRLARAAMDHLQLEDAHHILEIGCGGGGAGLELFDRITRLRSPAHLTLTDISNTMINIARTRFSAQDFEAGYLKIERADAQALPYANESFDRIFSCLNLMLVPDATAMIRECARVLKPDGLGIWVVWGRPEHSHMMTITSQSCAQIGLTLPPLPRSTFYLGGRDTLKDLLEENEFSQVRRWYQPMIADITTGEEFAKMTLALKPELKELADGSEMFQRLEATLTQTAQSLLDQGEGIGLDALIVIAKK
jgi:histidine triad (HIT) family protein